jgi:hypothetical protein
MLRTVIYDHACQQVKLFMLRTVMIYDHACQQVKLFMIRTVMIYDHACQQVKLFMLRTVASIVGQIIPTYSVIGNITYLMTKHLAIDNSKLLLWYLYIKLSESSTTESCLRVLYIVMSVT